MMDEADSAAKADACERFWDACKSGKYGEAADAYKDLHILVDQELEGEEGEEGEEKDEGKEKKPLAAILIGGPAKK
jgi:hypothetical protein